MTIIDDRTANRNYPKPNGANDLGDDVARIRTAFDAFDTDLASTLALFASKAAAVHNHLIADVLGLQAALDGKQDVGGVTGFAPIDSPTFTGTPAAPSPSGTDNSSRLANTAWVVTKLAGYSQTGHGHAISDVSGLTGALSGKVDVVTGGYMPKSGGAFTAAVTLVGNNPIGTNGSLQNDGSYTYLRGPGVAFQNASASNLAVLDTSGNFTATGNVTGFSDERIKDDWQALDISLLYELATLRAGTYRRTDLPVDAPRQVGVGAQSLEAILPEAVLTAEDGTKSVAYGNAALALVTLLARELIVMRARVANIGARQDAIDGGTL